MDYIDDWDLYNQKHRLSAKDYVTDNLYRLIKFFNIEDDYTIEEQEQILIDYFTKYPDQIQFLSIHTIGRPHQLAIPRLNNIGGVFKA